MFSLLLVLVEGGAGERVERRRVEVVDGARVGMVVDCYSWMKVHEKVRSGKNDEGVKSCGHAAHSFAPKKDPWTRDVT